MSLANSIQEMIKVQQPKSMYCSYYSLYLSLTNEDKTALDSVINDYSSNVLASVLRQEGYKIGKETINAHKKKLCRCPKIEINNDLKK